jgi:hypothetical protein
MPHSCFRIYDTNFVDTDILANQDFTSEQASFPATNVYNTQRRTKVWRTNGFYDVTASNNVIIFRETTGVDLTATIAVAEYSSRTSFLAAVKAALDAAGASTYTVAEVNLKTKITSNGAGGGGLFQLMTSDGSFTAEDILGYSTTDKTGALFYTADFVVIHSPSERLVWDFGVPTNPSAFILIGLRNDNLPYSPNGTIKLFGNETDNFSGTPSYSQTLTLDDQVISEIADENLHTEPVRYWASDFNDPTNGLGYIQVSNIFLGDYFDPARGRVQFPWVKQYIDRTVTSTSEGGQSFADIKDQTGAYPIKFFGLQIADVERFDEIFEFYGTGKPLFVSMDTDAVFSSNRNRRIIFARFDSRPVATLSAPDVYDITMLFKEDL